MPVVSTVKMTAVQFLVTGEDPPGVRLELVNGEVAGSPRPNLDHSFTLLVLTRILGQYIDDHDLGQLFTDVDTVIGQYDVRCPDALFIDKARVELLELKAVEVPPALCIEIVSPSSVDIDREDKFEQYLAIGVPHYWIVDPRARTVESFAADAGRYKLQAIGRESDRVQLDPFRALTIDLAKLWRPRKS